jgi:nucleoside-diphosphate-sugar epimerase
MLVENPALARSTFGAARAAGVRVVDISSIVVFSVDSARIDENSPLAHPGGPVWDDPYLQSKVIAERLGREMERDGLDRVTLYPGGVIGPEDRVPGTTGTVLISLLRGEPYLRGRLAWVDVRDVAAGIVAALTAPTGSTHLLTRGTESYRELAARLARLTDQSVRPSFPPKPVIRLLARANDGVRGRLFPWPVAAQLEYVMRCPALIDGSRAESTLGLTYRDLDESITDAIRWWAANGVLEPRLAGRLAVAS